MLFCQQTIRNTRIIIYLSDPLDIKGLVVRQIADKEEEIVEALFLASSQMSCESQGGIHTTYW